MMKLNTIDTQTVVSHPAATTTTSSNPSSTSSGEQSRFQDLFPQWHEMLHHLEHHVQFHATQPELDREIYKSYSLFKKFVEASLHSSPSIEGLCPIDDLSQKWDHFLRSINDQAANHPEITELNTKLKALVAVVNDFKGMPWFLVVVFPQALTDNPIATAKRLLEFLPDANCDLMDAINKLRERVKRYQILMEEEKFEEANKKLATQARRLTLHRETNKERAIPQALTREHWPNHPIVMKYFLLKTVDEFLDLYLSALHSLIQRKKKQHRIRVTDEFKQFFEPFFDLMKSWGRDTDVPQWFEMTPEVTYEQYIKTIDHSYRWAHDLPKGTNINIAESDSDDRTALDAIVLGPWLANDSFFEYLTLSLVDLSTLTHLNLKAITSKLSYGLIPPINEQITRFLPQPLLDMMDNTRHIEDGYFEAARYVGMEIEKNDIHVKYDVYTSNKRSKIAIMLEYKADCCEHLIVHTSLIPFNECYYTTPKIILNEVCEILNLSHSERKRGFSIIIKNGVRYDQVFKLINVIGSYAFQIDQHPGPYVKELESDVVSLILDYPSLDYRGLVSRISREIDSYHFNSNKDLNGRRVELGEISALSYTTPSILKRFAQEGKETELVCKFARKAIKHPHYKKLSLKLLASLLKKNDEAVFQDVAAIIQDNPIYISCDDESETSENYLTIMLALIEKGYKVAYAPALEYVSEIINYRESSGNTKRRAIHLCQLILDKGYHKRSDLLKKVTKNLTRGDMTFLIFDCITLSKSLLKADFPTFSESVAILCQTILTNLDKYFQNLVNNHKMLEWTNDQDEIFSPTREQAEKIVEKEHTKAKDGIYDILSRLIEKGCKYKSIQKSIDILKKDSNKRIMKKGEKLEEILSTLTL